MEGGAESGFKHVEGKEYTTRLLQLKGKRNVRVKQVETSTASLNEGDVFILDLSLFLLLLLLWLLLLLRRLCPPSTEVANLTLRFEPPGPFAVVPLFCSAESSNVLLSP